MIQNSIVSAHSGLSLQFSRKLETGVNPLGGEPTDLIWSGSFSQVCAVEAVLCTYALCLAVLNSPIHLQPPSCVGDISKHDVRGREVEFDWTPSWDTACGPAPGTPYCDASEVVEHGSLGPGCTSFMQEQDLCEVKLCWVGGPLCWNALSFEECSVLSGHLLRRLHPCLRGPGEDLQTGWHPHRFQTGLRGPPATSSAMHRCLTSR